MGGDLHQSEKGGVVRVRVIPRAKVDEISEILQEVEVQRCSHIVRAVDSEYALDHVIHG